MNTEQAHTSVLTDHDVARELAQAAGLAILHIQKDFLAKVSAANAELTPELRSELGAMGDREGHEVTERLLAQLRPNDALLSEEGLHDISRHSAQRLWIVDPLDGTANYSRGGDEFAVHIALWIRNANSPSNIETSSVYIPHRNEMFSMDDVLAVNSNGPQPVNNSTIRLLVSRSRQPRELVQLCKNLESETGCKVRTIEMSSVGTKVAAIIRGDADIYVNTGGFHEWDIAAPLGVACHYGLQVCDRFGEEISFNDGGTEVPHAIISRPQFVTSIVKSLA